MKTKQKLIALALASAFAPQVFAATDSYWACASGSWSSTCWSPTLGGAATSGPPPAGDTWVHLTQSDAVNRVVGLDVNYLGNLASLEINATGTGTMTLSQTSGTSYLWSENEFVGVDGSGKYFHSGGVNAINNNLYLGTVSGGNGSYELTGTGSLNARFIFVGNSSGASGNFIQSNGTSTSSALVVGGNGTGTYLLSGGSLTASYTYVGLNGSGSFSQIGGTHSVTNDLSINNGTYTLAGGSLSVDGSISGAGTLNLDGGSLSVTGNSIQVGNLNLGYGAGTVGNYTLAAGKSVTATNDLTIGNKGTGNFTQNDGTNAVSNTLFIGREAGGMGTYRLNGGTLSSAYQQIGVSGTGTFVQTGGSNTVYGNVLVGIDGGGSGSYELKGTGSLHAGGLYLGHGGSGSFVQSDASSATFDNAFYVGHNGSGHYVLNGGSLAAPTVTLGFVGTGTFDLQGGSLSAQSTLVGQYGKGTFNQNAGTHTLAGSLYVGLENGATGAYNLAGGSLVAPFVGIGYSGSGSLNQTGGTASFQTLEMGSNPGSSGSYSLSGTGQLTVANETIGWHGSGSFTQSGGYHSISNDLVLGGTYTLSGGTLYIGGNVVAGPNKSTFNLDGGWLGVNGNSIALYNFNIAKAPGSNASFVLATGKTLAINGAMDNSGTFDLAGGVILGSGDLTNNGLMSASGIIANVGGLTNNGAFVQTGNLNLGFNTSTNRGTMDLANGKRLSLDNSLLINQGTLALNGATVTGSGTLDNRAAGTLTGNGRVETSFGNAGTLALDNGTTTITGDFHNSGVIQMGANSAILSGGTVTNAGNIEGRGKINNAILNVGAIESQFGTLTLAGAVHNAGALVAGNGSTLRMQSGLASNAGNIQLNGGTFDNRGFTLSNTGQIQASAGASVIRGNVTGQAGSQAIVSGGGTLTFYDTVDIKNGAELRVSDFSAAVFFGQVYQRNGAIISGYGTQYYEGGLSIGDSPGSISTTGSVTFNAGNLYLAEIGGTTPGTGFDFYSVGGRLSFGGTLKLESYGSFVAQAGQTFDLFDWGTTRGAFSSIDSTGFLLAAGTTLDTSKLYIDGSISIAAVPEPESYAMFLAGLGLLGFIARRRKVGAGRTA